MLHKVWAIAAITFVMGACASKIAGSRLSFLDKTAVSTSVQSELIAYLYSLTAVILRNYADLLGMAVFLFCFVIFRQQRI